MAMPRRDLTGQRFGRLFVEAYAKTDAKHGELLWRCRCDCGTVKTVRGCALKSGTTVSCGCLRIEKHARRLTTHGMSASPEFSTWHGMLGRSHTGSADCAPRYLGRGITVCERWLVFENFLADMGPRPTGTTLDRINNDGNYEPGNCRWATLAEQARNKRTNHSITAFGRTQTIADWAREIGISAQAVRWRLRSGWTTEFAVSTPGRFA